MISYLSCGRGPPVGYFYGIIRPILLCRMPWHRRSGRGYISRVSNLWFLTAISFTFMRMRLSKDGRCIFDRSCLSRSVAQFGFCLGIYTYRYLGLGYVVVLISMRIYDHNYDTYLYTTANTQIEQGRRRGAVRPEQASGLCRRATASDASANFFRVYACARSFSPS